MTIQERWTPGTVEATYTSVVGTEINSVVSGNAVISSVQIDNSVIGDMYGDISISLGSVTTGSGQVFFGVYAYPLNQDGTTYGDNRFGSSAAGTPPLEYWVGNITAVPSTAGVVTGTIRGVILPFSKFKLVLWNQLGVTLASSANVVKLITYNRKIGS